VTVSMTGGMALARMLEAYDVGPMFGMAGFQLLPFYDAVHELGLNHYLVNDERTGAFAADAYARVTGRPGVCDGTLGPGATNLITGLVESLNAGVPVVALTGNANRLYAGKNMTQESEQVQILRPAVKQLIRIEDGRRIPELVKRAFAVATSGRPGPVVLDVPEDIAHGEFQFHEAQFVAQPEHLQVPAYRTRPDAEQVERAASAIVQAQRPVMLIGGGVHLSRAYEALTEFVDRYQIPVAHTMSGKGGIACNHPLALGVFGRYSRIANEFVAESDCLLVVGCKLGEISTKRFDLIPAGVPLIHLDVDAEEFGRTTDYSVGLWGDAALGIADLGKALGERARKRSDYLSEVATRKTGWRQGVEAWLTSSETPVNIARLVHEMNEVLPDDTIVLADGGFAAHWTGLLYDTKKAGRTYIADRGFASIGYGLPGAIGAQLAAPERPVVSLTGDSGFNMTLGDLETARRLGLPLTIVVVNNQAQGYVKALQHAMFEGHFQSSDLHPVNYADVAIRFGCHGVRVETPNALAGALQEALDNRSTPTVIDVVVTKDPARMLPGVDNRAVRARPGDRIA